MKLAGLLGCGSILHAACREDEETAEPSKFPALEAPLEGGGWRDGNSRAVLGIAPTGRVSGQTRHPTDNSFSGAEDMGGISQWEGGSGRGGIHPPTGP